MVVVEKVGVVVGAGVGAGVVVVVVVKVNKKKRRGKRRKWHFWTQVSSTWIRRFKATL